MADHDDDDGKNKKMLMLTMKLIADIDGRRE